MTSSNYSIKLLNFSLTNDYKSYFYLNLNEFNILNNVKYKIDCDKERGLKR
jgi:hypothetical protein